MTDLPRAVMRLADLSTRKPTPFALTPDADERAAIAQALDLLGLPKLRFSGQIAPQGRSDWTLTAELGATAIQPCVVTLAPVTTRIDDPVARTYVADLPDPDGAEVEMPEDTSVEPLPAAIDLVDVMIEALSLALPDFPRAADATLDQTTFAAPGVAPMSDDDAKPFAGLAALRDKLGDPPSE